MLMLLRTVLCHGAYTYGWAKLDRTKGETESDTLGSCEIGSTTKSKNGANSIESFGRLDLCTHTACV